MGLDEFAEDSRDGPGHGTPCIVAAYAEGTATVRGVCLRASGSRDK